MSGPEGKDRPALSLDEILAEGGGVSFRRFAVLSIRNVEDGEEQIAKLGADHGTYAGALRELGLHVNKHPGAWITEIFYQFDLESEEPRRAFIRMFEDTEREARRMDG